MNLFRYFKFFQSATCSDPPRLIIGDAIRDASDDVLSSLPSQLQMSQNINRERQKNAVAPPPVNYEGMEIPEALQMTADGEQRRNELSKLLAF